MVRLAVANALGTEPTASPNSRWYAWPKRSGCRQNRCLFWAEVTDAAGRSAITRQVTPDGYDLTVQTLLAAATRVLRGDAPLGFQTPAMAFGPDFILEIPGVTRTDDPAN